MKYKVSFTIKPSKKKVTLGINSFDKLLEEKIKWWGNIYGKVTKLKKRSEMGKKDKLKEELYVLKYKYREQKKGNMVSRKEVLKDLLKIGFYIGEYLEENEQK